MSIDLRPLSRHELQILADSAIPQEITKYVVAGALPPAFVAARALAHLAEGKSSQWCSTFYILRKSDGAIVGGCGFKDAPRDGRVEIGYAVAPSCRNQGIATKAVRELTRLAFASAEVHEVLAEIAPDNEASMRTVRKLNFAHCGIKDGDENLVLWLLRKSTSRD